MKIEYIDNLHDKKYIKNTKNEINKHVNPSTITNVLKSVRHPGHSSIGSTGSTHS